MSTKRDFDFPISTLTRSAGQLLGAINDQRVGPDVKRRLGAPFVTSFTNQIKLVEDGGTDQSSAAGDINALTDEQKDAFEEMQHLTGAARHSAGLFIPYGDSRLRSEFQVGVHEPQTLSSELGRAAIIAASCGKYATQLAEHGWLAEDTQALLDVIKRLGDTDTDQEDAGDEKIGITATRNRNANTLFAMCKSVQNAAELSHPKYKIGKVDGIEEARARFLLDEFPPRPPKKDAKTPANTTSTPTN